MIAVIAGGTGLVGSLLVKKLFEDSDFSKVISVSRRPLPEKNEKLTEVIINNLSDMQNESTKLKGDIYFCCLGTTIKDAGSKSNFEKIDFDAVVAFAKIARIHDAKSFSLISASGASSNSGIFYSQVKGKTENALKQLKFNRLVIFRPALLMGNRKNFRFGERIFIEIVRFLSPIIPKSLERRISTEIEVLSSRLKDEGKKLEAGILAVEAKDIK